MPKGPPTSKNDVILTGFIARGPHNSASNIDEFGESESDLDLNLNGVYQEPAICLDLLKTMITTVLENDSYIFTPAEIKALLSIRDLSEHAQHLFTYLVIHPKWHRLQALKLVDIPWGDLSCTIAELCRPIQNDIPALATADSRAEVKSEPMDLGVKMEEAPLDLSESVAVKKEEPFEMKFAAKSEPLSNAIPGPSDAGPSTLFPFPRPEPNPSSLCITDSGMTLRQLLEYMDPLERKDIATQLKIKTGKKKMELIDSILKTSSTQTTLQAFFGKGKAKAESEKPKANSQEERLRAMIIQRLEKLVRIDEDVFQLLLRVHIAYFRSTQFPAEILPRPLRHLQRKYPEYVRARAIGVWDNRETFMEYVDCLRAEVRITGVLPSDDAEPSSPERTTGKRKRPAVDDEAEVKDKKAAAVRKAKATKRLFDQVFQRWSQHLGLKVQNGPVSSGLERLEPGYTLTRVVHKGLDSLKILKKRNSELDVLDILLEQDHWCRGLRGPWHVRKTNILAEKVKDSAAGDAIPAIGKGLRDLATGSIYRQPLITNLAKLQKRLQVEDSVDIPEPRKVSKIVYEATRIATTEKKKSREWTGKDGDVGSIERLVSEHYELEFERVMTGGHLLTTLFTLLFWDIIFMPMAGYSRPTSKRAPSTWRQAVDFLERHDSQHRDAKATAVGVRWDLCARKDLVEAIECVPSNILVAICQMFCEDYVEACLGAPDVIALNVEDSEYKLVHIKGPGYPSSQSKKACGTF
ncbi:hypothetical protein B0H13DRAFT_2662458 [Mycena leptocephala]|nr:hypothetical protein B0H13DRAFT_2662458 [Mycena leptocephala]